MKVYVKKENQGPILSRQGWLLRGVLVKQDTPVSCEEVRQSVQQDKARMYRIGNGYVVCKVENHDFFYKLSDEP